MAKNGASECKPDYELQAASLKVKLDSTNNLKEALLDFFNHNGIYNFRKISSFAEMVGGIEIIKLEQSAHYKELLNKIESGT